MNDFAVFAFFTLMEEKCHNATICKMKARGLQRRICDFRQFVLTRYPFPAISVSKSLVHQNIRLSRYELLHTEIRPGLSRVLLAIRKNVKFVRHPAGSDISKEYLVPTVCHDVTSLTVIAGQVPPAISFNSQRPAAILPQPPPRHACLTGIINAHHSSRGSKETRGPGRTLVVLAASYGIPVVNDGSPTFFHGVKELIR